MENGVFMHDGVAIELVESDKHLLEVISKLKNCRELALDLEFDQNRYTYGFNLCLIQLTGGDGTCYIIDPLPLADLSPLFTLLEDPSSMKIIHHSNNDIMLLSKLGCQIKGVMDTDVAAKLLNYERSSLATVLKEEFNQEIDKSQQSSNWNKRPLTHDQLKYAAIDVIYLHQVKQRLVEQLEAKGRLEWLKEENQLLEKIRYSEPENPHLKLRNAFRLNLYQQYILQRLYAFREEMARQFNKPSSFVIGNESLVELATDIDTDINEWLNHTKGIHGGLKKARNEQLLIDVIATAKHDAITENISHESAANRYYRPLKTPETEQRKEMLTQVQKRIMELYGEFTSRLIINQSIITEYSQTGQLRCTKQYATAIVLSAAQELNIILPEPEIRAKLNN